MKTRSLAFSLAVAALIALAVPSVALANMEPHGNYADDTDACAGCHRAHTSYSTVTWTTSTPPTTQRSALLIGDTNFMWEFCYSCHDGTSQGADTNVEDGIYEGTLYGTNGAMLNGGGFGRPDNPDPRWTSTHLIAQETTQAWGAYGGGDAVNSDPQQLNYLYGQGVTNFPNPGATAPIVMDCGTCHDPHGSPNYRILKTAVDGEPVGGYDGAGDPDPFVYSVEPGYPSSGFDTGQSYPAYVPNYTTPMYAKGYDQGGAVNTAKGMSGWCAGCHDHYVSSESTYNAGDGAGLKLRHRHPMNVELTTYDGADKVNMSTNVANLQPTIPLANDLGGSAASGMTDWVECLTCHRAHGTNATMEGFASEAGMASVVDQNGFSTNPYVGSEVSALLRLDNRTACQGCHQK